MTLDGGSKVEPPWPWYREPTAYIESGLLCAKTGDHPGMVVPLTLENRVRSYLKNFLVHCWMEREFWTILTALEQGGKPQYIAYIQWLLRYEFKLTWKDGKPQPFNMSRIGVVRQQTLGRPDVPDMQVLLDQPGAERANQVGWRAEQLTITGAPPNRIDLNRWWITVPDNFWT